MTTVPPRSPIPERTPPSTLRRLLAASIDPATPVPLRYHITVLTRIVALLAVAGETGRDS
jgi:hypothetical protein